MTNIQSILELMMMRSVEDEPVKATYQHETLNEYVTNYVKPAIGNEHQVLTRKSWVPRLGRHKENGQSADPNSYQGSQETLVINSPYQWKRTVTVNGVDIVSGCDGSYHWSYQGDKRVDFSKTVDPHEVEECAYGQPPHGVWISAVAPDFRIMLEPAPLLAMMKLISASPARDSVVTLDVKPRNVDLINSSLISPWAAKWEIDVNSETGIVIRAESFLSDGRIAVQHKPTELEVGVEVAKDEFSPRAGLPRH